jgi:hypothetical protein
VVWLGGGGPRSRGAAGVGRCRGRTWRLYGGFSPPPTSTPQNPQRRRTGLQLLTSSIASSPQWWASPSKGPWSSPYPRGPFSWRSDFTLGLPGIGR